MTRPENLGPRSVTLDLNSVFPVRVRCLVRIFAGLGIFVILTIELEIQYKLGTYSQIGLLEPLDGRSGETNLSLIEIHSFNERKTMTFCIYYKITFFSF